MTTQHGSHTVVPCNTRCRALPIRSLWAHHLDGVVVKVSASGAEDPEFDSHLRCGDFSRLRHASELKTGNPVANLSRAWCFRVCAGIG